MRKRPSYSGFFGPSGSRDKRVWQCIQRSFRPKIFVALPHAGQTIWTAFVENTPATKYTTILPDMVNNPTINPNAAMIRAPGISNTSAAVPATIKAIPPRMSNNPQWRNVWILAVRNSIAHAPPFSSLVNVLDVIISDADKFSNENVFHGKKRQVKATTQHPAY